MGRLQNADGTEGEEFDSTYNVRVRARERDSRCPMRALHCAPDAPLRLAPPRAPLSEQKKKKAQEPLVVKAGVGKLIAGWDAALLEMSVGEKVILTIPPEGAYGAKGMPPKIPPNATLVFEVELVAVMD